MSVTFYDSSNVVTLQTCIETHENGVDVIFDEGRHITLEIPVDHD